ncbi:MAG: helix-turn-helix domain-containing protein [Lachnospiraceae bacterium]|nr:helix-turn-helix domain-containing protein [Lachnospiraceae bacterium]
MESSQYEKLGYLHDNFKMFHLKDSNMKPYDFHYHDFIKILVFLSGDVSYCIEGKTYDLQPYDIVLVNAGEVHKPIVHSDKEYHRMVFYISQDYLLSVKTDSCDLSYCFEKAKREKTHVLRISSPTTNLLYQSCKKIESSLDDNDFGAKLYHELLFLEFMIHLNRSSIHNKIHFLETNCANPKVISAIEYINQHLTTDLYVEDIAEHLFLSKFHLMHIFKEETGYSIGNYISTKRLFLARELIAKGHPITEACFSCGFNHYSTFSRAYKKLFKDIPRTLLKE